MSLTKEIAAEHAKADLADRLNISVDDITQKSISDKEFPDMALGAPEKNEMSAQMISSGWQIKLAVKGTSYEYRADKYHLRLHNYNGANYVIE